jgi:probable O-glycosylation ligase (exosortase A-associated)
MRDVALTALVFGLLPFCFARPWIGILAWYWMGLMNPHMFTWGFARGIPFAMLIAVATLTGTLVARDRRPIPWNRELVLVVALMAYFTLTTVFAWAPVQAWRYLEQVAKILLMTFVATMFIYGKTRVRALMLVIGLSLAFYGIKGAIFTVMTGGAHRVQAPEGIFIGENTFLGLALNMVIPILVCLARDEPRRALRVFLNFAAACCVLSSVFTYSRGALVGLAIVLPLLFLRDPRKAWGTVGFLLVAGALVISFAPDKLWKRAETIETYQEDRSAMQRFRAWGVAWNVAKERPLTGAGFQFEFADRARWLSYVDQDLAQYGRGVHAAHSLYFQVLGQHGFIALGLYLLLMGFTLTTLTRLRRRAATSSEGHWIGTYSDGLRIGIIAFAISGAFLSVAYFDLYFIFVAMTAILARELAKTTQSAAATAATATALAAPQVAPVSEKPRA